MFVQTEQDEKGNYFNYLFKLNEITKEYTIIKIENNNKEFIVDFDANNEYLVVLNWKEALIYKFEKNTYIFNDKYCCSSYRNVSIKENFLILCECKITSFTMNKKNHTQILKYDIKKKEIISDEWLPNPEGFQFTFFGPRNLIEANSNYTLVADAINYKIKAYNSKNEVTDEISRKDVDWKTHPTTDSILKSIYITNTEIKYEIDKLRPLTGLISLIHRMSFINDSTFVFCFGLSQKR